MKRLKKRIAAALLSAALCAAGFAGCGSTPTWAVQDGERTLPVGTYICNLITSYQNAVMQADLTQDLFAQEIDGVPVNDWIKQEALRNTKGIFYVDDKLEELGVSLSEEEEEQITSLSSLTWSQVEDTFEPFGVSEDSFETAYAAYGVKMAALFEAIYGPGGTEPVSDGELEQFFNENYVHLEYLMMPLFDAVSEETDGKSSEAEPVAWTEEELAEAKELFDGYAGRVSRGAMTMEEAAEGYAESGYAQNDAMEAEFLLQDSITPREDLASDYPAEFIAALDALEPGEASTLHLTLPNGEFYLLIYTDEIAPYAEEYLSGETNRNNTLGTMKYDEFLQAAYEEIDAMDVTVNEEAVSHYDPQEMFS